MSSDRPSSADLLAGQAPYTGVRVIELANDPAGEMVGLQLANMGADVVKIEPPEGANSRQVGPFVDDVEDPDRSLEYWYYNVGKRSIVLDYADLAGLASFERLLGESDVLISSLHPTELRRYGLDLDALAGDYPDLIIVSVTPFGLTGPWADRLSSDLVGMAASGLLMTSGYDDHTVPPIRPGGNQAFHTAASFAHQGLLLALIERQLTGRGALIDVSMHEAAAMTVELANMYWFYPRVLVQRQTCRHAQPVPTQPALFPCADGRYIYFVLILADAKPWRMLVEWLESEGLATDLTDAAYSDLEYRQQNFAHIQEILEVFFLLRTAEAAFHDGQARALPIGILNAPEDLYHDEHLIERGFFQSVEHPGFGDVRYPRPPWRMSTYEAAERRPAPSLGEHSDDVLGRVVAGEGAK
jgi:crotonobetainyl-CoA:carnitine CoA-transferase CaiB-like acyl-CoA transferase